MEGRTGALLLEHCSRLIGAELTFPFGPDLAVFKVGGRIFALFAGAEPAVDPDRVSVKCDPEYAAALRREHAAITPGYHLNKRHWITVEVGAQLPVGLVPDLLVDSYDLVVDGLPPARRPLGRQRRAAPTAGAQRAATPGQGAPSAGSGREATAQAVRRVAAQLPEVTEGGHHDVLDFRVRGRIFATVPTEGVVVVRLPAADQAELIAVDPRSFAPAAGSWGRQGWTRVQVGGLGAGQLAELLVDAWAARAPVTLARQLRGGPAPA